MTQGYLRGSTLGAALALVAGLGGLVIAQAPAPYTVVSRESRRPLPVRSIGGQEMFALEDLARLFELTLREEAAAGGLIVSTRTQAIVLTPGQPFASVAGRLISLPAAPVRDGRAWFVPVDFLSRALAPALANPLEVRRPSRLILLGDVRLPRVSGRIEPVGSGARLTLDIAPSTPHTVVQEGNRLLVRFEADGLDAALPSSSVPELIQSLRTGDGAPVIVVDLGAQFGSFRVSDLAGERGATRSVIEVSPPTTTEPAAPTPPPSTPPPTEPPPLLDLVPPGGLRTIVIDAGHGGEEHGARGPDGTLEKEVTLSVARRLKAGLESRLGVRVILTRDGDHTVGLDERAAVANNNKADLFLSLHANASVRDTMTGAEVFYLSLDEYGEQARRVAQTEREALPLFGGGTRDIDVILWEMAQARYIQQSARFAAAVEAALRSHVPMSPRAIQQAPFRVLVGANMPAVLVELGFITNPQQEKQLKSDSFQNTLVQAMIESIVQFRDRPGTQTSGSATHEQPRAGSSAPGRR